MNEKKVFFINLFLSFLRPFIHFDEDQVGSSLSRKKIFIAVRNFPNHLKPGIKRSDEKPGFGYFLSDQSCDPIQPIRKHKFQHGINWTETIFCSIRSWTDQFLILPTKAAAAPHSIQHTMHAADWGGDATVCIKTSHEGAIGAPARIWPPADPPPQSPPAPPPLLASWRVAAAL